MHEQIKNIPFELKELSDDGDFVGIASVYGNVDLGNDVVDKGAFDQSIADRGNKVRLMDSHKVRIGVATVETTPIGLKATGKINTKKQSGMEALSDLRFYRDNGMPMGMSIGYETLKADMPHQTKDGARHLKEVRLWEVTVTEFPMNERAQVVNVKSVQSLIDSVKADRAGGKKDFDAELQEILLWGAPYSMLSALSCALSDIRNGEGDADPVAASAESFDQAKAQYCGMLPDYMALMTTASMEWMSRPGFEQKSGRVLSQSNLDLIDRVMKDLQALRDSGTGNADVPEKAAGPNGPTESKSESSTEDTAEETGLIAKIIAEIST